MSLTLLVGCDHLLICFICCVQPYNLYIILMVIIYPLVISKSTTFASLRFGIILQTSKFNGATRNTNPALIVLQGSRNTIEYSLDHDYYYSYRLQSFDEFEHFVVTITTDSERCLHISGTPYQQMDHEAQLKVVRKPVHGVLSQHISGVSCHPTCHSSSSYITLQCSTDHVTE